MRSPPRHGKPHQEPEPPNPQSLNRPPAERRRGVATRAPNQPRTLAYLPLHAALSGLPPGAKISTAYEKWRLAGLLLAVDAIRAPAQAVHHQRMIADGESQALCHRRLAIL